MIKPRANLWLSAAQFFEPSQARRENNFQVSLVPLSLQLLLRLGLMACLLIALWPNLGGLPAQPNAAVNLWILLDTSASMTTVQSEQTRWAAALEEAQRAIEAAAIAANGQPFCIQLSGFDMERYPQQGNLYRDARLAGEGLGQFNPRSLGTEIGIVLQAVADSTLQVQENECPPTHIVVITDLPAPATGLDYQGEPRIIWRDVAVPIDNIGFTELASERDPLTGGVQTVTVQMRAYGEQNAVRLVITDSEGQTIETADADWLGDTWVFAWQPSEPGRYQLKLEPADAYNLDNQAAIEVAAPLPLAALCNLPDCSFIDLIGWRSPELVPQLLITDRLDDVDETLPTLIIGSGYQPVREVTPIVTFKEGHPLLADLHFDILEHMGITGRVGAQVPTDFAPILSGQDGVWIAARETPPAVIVPGLPFENAEAIGEQQSGNNVSLTIFFNAIRWLIQTGPTEPLFTLTSPAFPTVEGNRIALFEGEGDTTRAPISIGEVSDIAPKPVEQPDPLWPVCLALAALFFFIERFLAASSERWK
jgi:hypothetical protein